MLILILQRVFISDKMAWILQSRQSKKLAPENDIESPKPKGDKPKGEKEYVFVEYNAWLFTGGEADALYVDAWVLQLSTSRH